jgi:hypothetical protein
VSSNDVVPFRRGESRGCSRGETEVVEGKDIVFGEGAENSSIPVTFWWQVDGGRQEVVVRLGPWEFPMFQFRTFASVDSAGV